MASPSVQHGVRRHHSAGCPDLKSDRLFPARVSGDVPELADGGRVRREDEAVLAAVDGRGLRGVGERDDGFAGCEGDVSIAEKERKRGVSAGTKGERLEI